MSGEIEWRGGEVAVPFWLIRTGIRPYTLRVYEVPATYRGSDGIARVARQPVAASIGCSISTVKRAFTELRRLGMIQALHRPGQACEFYVVRPEALAEVVVERFVGSGVGANRGDAQWAR